MLECLVLGDSIAVGVGGARPACQTVAKVGITSGAYLQTMFPAAPHRAPQVVISLGVNDDPSMNTLENLRQMRQQLTASQVTWLLPGLKDDVRRAIQTVAAEHRDRTVDTRSQAGADHLHPSREGYRTVAAWTEQRTGPATPPVPAFPTQVQAAAHPFMPLPSARFGVATGRTVASSNGSLLSPVGTVGGRSAYALWPTPGVVYGALPPANYAYGGIPFRRP